MKAPVNPEIVKFLSQYDDTIMERALVLRELIFQKLPDITEQRDEPAKMIGYCYGQKYADLICTLIPSKKGLKLGFNRGTELPDPDKLLEGGGKISRYVVIDSTEIIQSTSLKNLFDAALKLYQQRAAI